MHRNMLGKKMKTFAYVLLSNVVALVDSNFNLDDHCH